MVIPPFIRSLVRDCFTVGLVTFAVYFFADLVKPGLVTNYINLNLLLLCVIVVGIIHILLTDSEK